MRCTPACWPCVVVYSSCLFGGTCIDGVNSYQCSCAPGYTGSNCQHRINPCDSRPCLNGAACIDRPSTRGGPASYECVCPHGFAGPRCDSFVDWCAANRNPCANGGTCRQDGNQFQCTCRPGWDGPLCDVMMVSCSIAAAQKSMMAASGLILFYNEFFDCGTGIVKN